MATPRLDEMCSKTIRPIKQFAAVVLSFVATYVAAFVFLVLLPTRLSPRVAAAIAFTLVASVGFVTGFAGGRSIVLHHSAGTIMAATLFALTALAVKQGLDNPVKEPAPFPLYAQRHFALGLMIIVGVMLASLGGFYIGQARPRR